jgi:hypothetical protein
VPRITSSRATPSETGKPPSSGKRLVTALEPVREATPDDETYREPTLSPKQPTPPVESSLPPSPVREPLSAAAALLAPVPILPSSPPNNLVELVSKSPDVGTIITRREPKGQEMMQSSVEMIHRLREVGESKPRFFKLDLNFAQFLSNSRNIWSHTAIFELAYLMQAVIPWRTLPVGSLYKF